MSPASRQFDHVGQNNYKIIWLWTDITTFRKMCRDCIRCDLYTGWFSFAFHKFEGVLYDHKQVKNVNTNWSGNVSILIYSPSKFILATSFLGLQTMLVRNHVHPWCSCLPYIGGQEQVFFFSKRLLLGYSAMWRKWFRHNHRRHTLIWKMNYC
jgi:hypothetical protein